MSILLDILLGAVFGISIIVLTYIIYRIQETKSAKNKRKETTQELNENILTLKKQKHENSKNIRPTTLFQPNDGDDIGKCHCVVRQHTR